MLSNDVEINPGPSFVNYSNTVRGTFDQGNEWLLSYFEKIAHMSVVQAYVSLWLCGSVALWLCGFVCWDVCCKSQ